MRAAAGKGGVVARRGYLSSLSSAPRLGSLALDDNLPAGSHRALSVAGHVWAWATLNHYGGPLRRCCSPFGVAAVQFCTMCDGRASLC